MVLRLVYIVIALTVLNTVIGAQLIEVGSELRYFPVEPGAAAGLEDWYMPGYDDTGWDSGASGIGYMKGFTATRINEEVQEPPCSILLRKRFIVDDVKVIEHLLLRVEFTGGFIAYLNGREITRHGLDVPMGSGVPFTATADYVSGGTVEVDMNEYISLLEPGINYLCLQLQPAYSGAAFGATPELSANLSRGPYLQNTTVDSVKVVWKSIAPAAGRVEFGMDRALNNVVVDGSPGTNHVVSLTNLEPDTVYYYRVVNETDDIEARSEVFSFRTFKESGALTFMVLGDSGEGSKAQYNIAEVIRNEGADLIVHLGDLVYPYYHRDLEDVRLFSVYRDIFTGTPFFSALGNHEMYVSIQSYFDAFDFPADSSGTEAYYSFDHGDAHFVVLDTESKVGEGEVISSEQLQWLEGDLAAATAKWKFLFFHKPARSSGLHRFDDYNLNGKYDYVEIQNVLDPLIKEYGVQAVFNAHDHDYERLGPVNGSVFVVSGGGGGPLYSMSERDPASVRFQSRYNCLKVTVNGDVTRIRALGEDGEVFDETTVCIAPHDDAVAYAVRHTPEVESTPADDGDGNIAGQMFDFAGPGIPAISGESSNPGEYYFNYDQYEFFVGIKNVSIFPGQTLFLFIGAEAPNEVCSLEGLGNDVIDPEGQGADGLDFLEHLVFTNFMPMAGCILGDETADGTYRDFDSRGASINTGQGVFHLNPTLDPIAGARLQQFNQSPQTSIVPNEENADFIEVSIPLGVLGNPAPGDEVCVAAVVGLDTVKTNISEQSRRLDSGFFGAGMSADNGISVIRGIRAKLDHDPDGDGMTSYEEAVAGTNPDDPESLLEMYVEQDGEIIEMSWRAATGRVYRVESSLKVNGPFQLLDELIIDGNELTPGGGAVVSITNRIESAQGEFYRLRVDQIPPGG